MLATRFGSDKALALLDGRSLIDHTAPTVSDKVAHAIVCGRTLAPAGLTAVLDWPLAGLGPLGGLCAALRHVEARGYDAVLSIGRDTPAMSMTLIERLTAGGGARFLGQAPIIGYWPADLADAMSAHLSLGDERAVYRWAAAVGAEPIDAGGDLPNINRASDLDRLATSISKLTYWTNQFLTVRG